MKTIKTLARFLSEYKKDTFLTWGLVLFESCCEIAVAYLIRFLVDFVKAGDMNSVYLYAGIIAILALVAALTGVAAGYFASSASVGLGKNLRKAMYHKIQNYSFSNIDRFSTSSIVTRMTTDVTNVQNAFMQVIRAVLRAPLMMIFSIIMCFLTEARLAWIFLLLVPVALGIMVGLATWVHPLFVKVFDEYDVLNEKVQEDLDGMRVVKSFNQQDSEKKRFGFISNFIFKAFSKAEKMMSFNNPTLQFAIYLSMLLIALVGGRFIIYGTMTTGEMSSLLTFVMMIFNSLMMVTMVYVMITIARNSAERIAEIILEQPDLTSPKDGITTVKDGSFSYENACFGYDKQNGKLILKDINLRVESGKSIGIIGPIGCGKSTLASLLARLFDTSSGTVEVGGINVKDYDLKTLRDSVAVVLQKNTLFTGTIASNLRWGNEKATQEELVYAAKLACADDFICSFPDGYNSKIEEGGTNVSGGQKQRLCIARALLKKPKILIMDDSTNAIDTHTDALIRGRLKDAYPGMTRLIISQRVLSIRDCDEIFVMEGGNIVSHGTSDELMKSSQVYKELYESQLGGGDFDAR